MSSSTLTFLLFTLILIISLIILFPRHRKQQPPGPPPLPIIGNLHMLGNLPHRSLQKLAGKYGPMMSLKLGQVPAIVVSSPEAAVQFLKTHDAVFATRPILQALDPFSKGNSSKGLAFAEYGPYWRYVRKLCTVHLLSASRVEMFAPLRREEVGAVVKSLAGAAAAREVVDVSKVVGELIENIIYRMVLGCANKDDGLNLKGLIKEALDLAGAFNLADYVPWLGALDLQGLTRKLKRNKKALDDAMDKILREHENTSSNQNNVNDFIHILLSLMHQSTIDKDHNIIFYKDNIKAIILDMVVGSIDTSIVTIEWALSELLRHPRVMKNLQNELQNVVGIKRMVEESDLSRLSYLDMVIKETLRLYPVAPLLIPRESMEDITISYNSCEYYVRRKTRVIVNVWAIGRDQKIWSENALKFYPERFSDGDIDVRGHDFELLPFGSGRRGCPGMNLGLTTVKLVVAQLVHCFCWELPGGMCRNDLDMNENFGLAISRLKHLLAIPTYRLHI